MAEVVKKFLKITEHKNLVTMLSNESKMKRLILDQLIILFILINKRICIIKKQIYKVIERGSCLN